MGGKSHIIMGGWSCVKVVGGYLCREIGLPLISLLPSRVSHLKELLSFLAMGYPPFSMLQKLTT